jgi:hypothetical protein
VLPIYHQLIEDHPPSLGDSPRHTILQYDMKVPPSA